MAEHSRVRTRRYPRYVVSGQARIYTHRYEGQVALVQIGLGGMLLRGGIVLPVGQRIRIQFAPDQYPYKITVSGEVVGTHNALMAIQFLEKQQPVVDLVGWLARGNCLGVKPVVPREALSTEKMRCATSIPRLSEKRDREAALEFMYGSRPAK